MVAKWSNPCFFCCISGFMLPSYIGIIINHLIRIPMYQSVQWNVILGGPPTSQNRVITPKSGLINWYIWVYIGITTLLITGDGPTFWF